MTADLGKDHLGRAFQSVRFGFQFGRREQAQRQVERFGEVDHRRFVGFHVDGMHRDQRARRNIRFRQHVADQCGQLLRRAIT